MILLLRIWSCMTRMFLLFLFHVWCSLLFLKVQMCRFCPHHDQLSPIPVWCSYALPNEACGWTTNSSIKGILDVSHHWISFVNLLSLNHYMIWYEIKLKYYNFSYLRLSVLIKNRNGLELNYDVVHIRSNHMVAP